MMNDIKESKSWLPPSEIWRIGLFVLIQLGFLAVSPLAGGFHRKVWSQLDSALLVSSIGITCLMFVLEKETIRKIAFKVAILLYILAVIDMSVNILLSGWLGWKSV
jgi:hypothetical protein